MQVLCLLSTCPCTFKNVHSACSDFSACAAQELDCDCTFWSPTTSKSTSSLSLPACTSLSLSKSREFGSTAWA